MDIPKHIIDTINTLLAPYGQEYKPQEETPEPVANDLMSYKEACEYCRCSHQTLQRNIRLGRLKFYTIGVGHNAKRLFRRQDLNSLMGRV